MKIRDLKLLAVPPHAPSTVAAAAGGGIVVRDLEPGESMPPLDPEGRAWLMPIAGEVELFDARGKRALAGPASLVELEPGERPEVRGRTRARLVLIAGVLGEAAEARADEAAAERPQSAESQPDATAGSPA